MTGTIAFENPESGEANATADQKVRAGLIKLKEELNGLLNSSNKVEDAALESHPNNSVYRDLMQGLTELEGSVNAYTTPQFFVINGTLTNPGTLMGPILGRGVQIFHFIKTDYEVTGRTLKLRLDIVQSHQISCSRCRLHDRRLPLHSDLRWQLHRGERGQRLNCLTRLQREHKHDQPAVLRRLHSSSDRVLRSRRYSADGNQQRQRLERAPLQTLPAERLGDAAAN